MTYRDIAKVMGISNQAVYYIERRALNKIRAQLFTGQPDQLSFMQLEWLSEIVDGRNPNLTLKTRRWRGVAYSLRLLKLIDKTGCHLTEAGLSLMKGGR